MSQTLLRAAPLVCLLPLTACLSYTPLGNVPPARGAEVSATVAPLDARVGELTVHRVTHVMGRVAFADADSVVIAGRQFTSEMGSAYQSIGDLVTIPRAQLVEIKQKRVSTWKTVVAVGATSAAVAAILAGIGPLSGFGGGGGDHKPPP